MKPKEILHLDIDAFYPSVEALDNPGLKGKPVIVGGRQARGVVASASYEARRFGVHSAQPIAAAARLCPEGIFLPVRMSRYRELSKQVLEIFKLFTPLVEPVSIDEAFLDVTDSMRLFGHPEEIAGKIKLMVFKETGLRVSAGVAPSKLLAKIASDIDKPDGLTIVLPDQVKEFLDPLPINKMWGVGKVTQAILIGLGVHTIGDLREMPEKILVEKFGKQGAKMHQSSRGFDDREVVPGNDIKSIGHEETFLTDIMEVDTAKRELLALAHKVARRMRSHGFEGKTVTLKVKYNDFVKQTRSTTLSASSDDGLEIYSTVCRLLKQTEIAKKPIRLLGISLSRLSKTGSEGQLSFFHNDGIFQKRKDLHSAMDFVSEKFGENSIQPGTLLGDR